MDLKVSPAETFAVLVGVERYAGGLPQLDGPANDAARFAEWLRSQDVPAQNIFTFVSMCRDIRDYPFPKGCRIQEATLPAVSHAIKHVIPSLAGKGLFFVWGGHGVVDDDRERHLFLGDATEEILESVPIPALLRFLRSRRIKTLPQQWFVIDACANAFLTPFTHLALAPLGLPGLINAQRHTQYVMFGASVGKKAVNLTAERKGLFAGEVLDALLASREWPPDLDAVTRYVEASFEKRRAQQAPEFRWYKMGLGEPFLRGSVYRDEGGTVTLSSNTVDAVGEARAIGAITLDTQEAALAGALAPRELDALFELAVLREAACPDELVRIVLRSEVLDAITTRLVTTVVDELRSGRLDCIAGRSLIRLSAFDFVQQAQRRSILEPVVRRLEASSPSSTTLLEGLVQSSRGTGAATANLVNLLSRQTGQIPPLDLSRTDLRNADFRHVAAAGVDLRGADLSGAAFHDAFTSMLAVAFSPDGGLLAAANADGIIRVWRLDDGRQQHALYGHTDWAWAVAFSPNGRMLASSGDDRTVRLWDLQTGAALHVLSDHTDWVRAIAFSPDGQLLASGSQDCTVRVWDVATGALVRKLVGHQDQVWSVAFNPRTRVLATASGDGTVCLWDVAAPAPTRRWESEGGRVFSVAFSPDGEWLATAGDTRDVRVWHAHTGRFEARLVGHEGRVWRAVFNATAETIVSSGEDNTIRIWDWRARSSRIVEIHTDWVRSVAHHPEKPWIASASDDQSVVVTDTVHNRTLRTWRGWSDPLFAVGFAPDSSAVFAGGRKGLVRWRLAEAGSEDLLVPHESRVWALAVSPANGVGASGGDDEMLRLWSSSDGTAQAVLDGHGKPIWSVAFAPGGELVATGSEDRTARIWRVADREQTAVCEGHTSWVRATAFSPDGVMLATGGDDRTVRLWRTNGDPDRVLEGHTGRVWSVVFHPAGSLLASGGDDSVVRVWAMDGSRRRIDLAGHNGRIWSAAFSPDGAWLATSSSDRTVRIWNVEEGHAVHVIEGHTRWVRSVTFAPDGSMLATASEDGTVRIWDGRTFAFIRSLARKRPYEGMLIAGAKGLSDAQREALILLGATDEP